MIVQVRKWNPLVLGLDHPSGIDGLYACCFKDRWNVGTYWARNEAPPGFLSREEVLAVAFADLSQERQF